LTSVESPKGDILNICKVGSILGYVLFSLTCSHPPCVIWLLSYRPPKSRRDLWNTLYITEYILLSVQFKLSRFTHPRSKHIVWWHFMWLAINIYTDYCFWTGSPRFVSKEWASWDNSGEWNCRVSETLLGIRLRGRPSEHWHSWNNPRTRHSYMFHKTAQNRSEFFFLGGGGTHYVYTITFFNLTSR
jgi:hypothetical protein